MSKFLDHGTVEHEVLYKSIRKRNRIFELTQNIDIRAIADDWIEELERYFMKRLEEQK